MPSSRALRATLLAWFDRQRRPLPWRRDRDPYRVWVAETMLQQTRIATVIPAYERFLQRFPTLRSLADGAEDDVLSLWSGLGYYSRARNLHRAARDIIAAGGTTFPFRHDEARALPGVGEYTAAAVLSIAYEQPYAAVDGNIRRVLARLLRLPPIDASGEPYRSKANDLLAVDRPGDWNQALMELGETICSPRTPLCGNCPLTRHCAAHRAGEVQLYPAPRLRRPRERHHLNVLVARDRSGRIVLERGAFAHLRHLWLPLQFEVAEPAAELAGEFKHAILHRDFRIKTYHRRLSIKELRRLSLASASERRVFAPAELESIGRSSLLTKALRLCRELS